MIAIHSDVIEINDDDVEEQWTRIFLPILSPRERFLEQQGEKGGGDGDPMKPTLSVV